MPLKIEPTNHETGQVYIIRDDSGKNQHQLVFEFGGYIRGGYTSDSLRRNADFDGEYMLYYTPALTTFANMLRQHPDDNAATMPGRNPAAMFAETSSVNDLADDDKSPTLVETCGSLNISISKDGAGNFGKGSVVITGTEENLTQLINALAKQAPRFIPADQAPQLITKFTPPPPEQGKSCTII